MLSAGDALSGVATSTLRRTTATTMLGALDEQAERFGDDPFLISAEDVVSTFADVRDRSRDLAAGLVHHGVEPGDRVAFMARNRNELVELTFGSSYGQMICVPVNVFLKGEFLSHQLINSAATAIAVDRTGLDALSPVLALLPDLRLVITLEPGLVVDGFSGVVIEYAELFGTGGVLACYEPGPLDTFLILYTSGTTGSSKGCMLSQAYMVRVGRVMSGMLDVVDDDVQLCVHPMFHMSGQMDLAIALITGTAMGVETQFSASSFFPRAKELGATFWGGPGISDLLLLQPATKDHKLRRWIGLPFSPQQSQTMLDKFGILSICQGYAQTESNPISSVGLNTPGAPETNGRVMADLDCQVVDDNDFPVPVGTVGEIVIRPRIPGAMFSGYWNDAERTLQGWRNLWHHTGDLGRFDEAGNLTFVDRKSDSMRRRGENISAMELERALLGFDPIAEVAVHAVRAQDQSEDDIKACIVLKPDATFDRESFAAFVNDRIPHFAVVRYYELLDSLPRNPIGRVQKFVLRKNAVTELTVDLFEAGLTSDRRKK